jgi:uncharacterized protein (TIGR03083 family)
MERQAAINQLRTDSRRVVELTTEDNLAKPVPSCPDWDYEKLAKHLSAVYNWAGSIVLDRLAAPPDRGTLPERPEGEATAGWLAGRAERVVAALENVPEDAEIWNFSPGPNVASFWWRRQMHETIIHRIDAELSAGTEITPVTPEIASDNVSEVLMMLGYVVVEPGEQGAADDGSLRIHLHATDVDPDNELGAWTEWTLDAGKRTLSQQHAKGNAAVRGPALDLARWCWGRGGSAEILGDAEAATEFRRSLGV